MLIFRMKIISLLFFFLISLNLSAKTGPVTGLEIPRFVSLKSDDVNLRIGPSTNYPIMQKYISLNETEIIVNDLLFLALNDYINETKNQLSTYMGNYLSI